VACDMHKSHVMKPRFEIRMENFERSSNNSIIVRCDVLCTAYLFIIVVIFQILFLATVTTWSNPDPHVAIITSQLARRYANQFPLV
jgi:hypothetical protein